MSINTPKIGEFFRARQDDGSIVQGIIKNIELNDVNDPNLATTGEITFELIIEFTNGKKLTVGVLK